MLSLLQVHTIVETNMEKGLLNYGKAGAEGVTETWNIIQHEVRLVPFTAKYFCRGKR